jgi:murein DD-endopeptidase MepM/ murein hydrolase activator NlpD
MRWLYALAALVFGLPAQASELHLEGQLIQGGVVCGQVAPGSAVSLDGRQLRLSADGWFVFGFGRDAAERAELVVRLPEGSVERRTLEVSRRKYRVERVNGLAPREVTPRKEDLARIDADARLVGAAQRRDSDGLGFTQKVAWPVVGRISGVYGSQRILNGTPRAPHRGLDIAAAPGTPVGAMASGVVSLAEPGMYFTGGTVMIDHGHGLHSIYAHLRDVLVEAGEDVAQGAIVGTVGSTGRAAGPHLHWGVYWFGKAVDPALLVGPMPQSLG